MKIPDCTRSTPRGGMVIIFCVENLILASKSFSTIVILNYFQGSLNLDGPGHKQLPKPIYMGCRTNQQ